MHRTLREERGTNRLLKGRDANLKSYLFILAVSKRIEGNQKAAGVIKIKMKMDH